MDKKTRRINFSLMIIALVAAGAALITMKSVFLPLVIAFFLASLTGPVVTWMRSKGIPQGIAIVLIIMLTGVLLYLLGWLFYSQATLFVRELDIYVVKLRELIDRLIRNISADSTQGESIWKRVQETVDWERLSSVLKTTAGLLGGLFGTLGTMLVILLYMVFLLQEREHYRFRVLKAWKQDEGGRINKILDQINKQVESYIIGKTITSLATGTLVTAVLWIFDVKYFFVFGLLTFMLNYIPSLGSVIATVLPLLWALAQPTPELSGGTILSVGAILVVIQFAVGNLVEPKLLGEKLHLSPFMVFFSLILWGWLWGIPGMILSTPIMATLKIIFENVDSLKPVADLISNSRPGTEKAGEDK